MQIDHLQKGNDQKGWMTQWAVTRNYICQMIRNTVHFAIKIRGKQLKPKKGKRIQWKKKRKIVMRWYTIKHSTIQITHRLNQWCESNKGESTRWRWGRVWNQSNHQDTSTYSQGGWVSPSQKDTDRVHSDMKSHDKQNKTRSPFHCPFRTKAWYRFISNSQFNHRLNHKTEIITIALCSEKRSHTKNCNRYRTQTK